jgi:hypothetical protein
MPFFRLLCLYCWVSILGYTKLSLQMCSCIHIIICCFLGIRSSVLSQLRYDVWMFKCCINLVEFLGRMSGLRKVPDYTWKHWQCKMCRYIHTCLEFEPTIWVFERSKRASVISRTAAVMAISFQIWQKLVIVCDTTVTICQCTAVCSESHEKFYKEREMNTLQWPFFFRELPSQGEGNTLSTTYP